MKIKEINQQNDNQNIIYASDPKEFYNKGKIVEVQIDKEEHSILKNFGWYISRKGYVYTMINNRTKLLHQMIMGVEDKNITIDHHNTNKLDNRKDNLIPMSNSDNALKGWYVQNRHEHEKISITMIDKNTNEQLMVFNSSSNVEKWVREYINPKASQGAIINVCMNIRRSAYGYKWKYTNERM